MIMNFMFNGTFCALMCQRIAKGNLKINDEFRGSGAAITDKVLEGWSGNRSQDYRANEQDLLLLFESCLRNMNEMMEGIDSSLKMSQEDRKRADHYSDILRDFMDFGILCAFMYSTSSSGKDSLSSEEMRRECKRAMVEVLKPFPDDAKLSNHLPACMVFMLKKLNSIVALPEPVI